MSSPLGETDGNEPQQFRVGKTRTGEVDPRGSSSLRDEDEGRAGTARIMIEDELTIEVDGVGISEAAFGAELRTLELKGEYVEAVIGPAHGGEEDGAFGFGSH
ncbi:hypothetical protein PanWU01x14_275520 [Parasponia andersonii]|uniref:Uncharacterized protein n=1 Tax=Parasponia andersonii TaxID=3476 RepID=A0A2P5B350_PARAD|nr:hypothetical protein PanWU01x14_275520 [Parasponia andersonii]